jgi:hypothetical protein
MASAVRLVMESPLGERLLASDTRCVGQIHIAAIHYALRWSTRVYLEEGKSPLQPQLSGMLQLANNETNSTFCTDCSEVTLSQLFEFVTAVFPNRCLVRLQRSVA